MPDSPQAQRFLELLSSDLNQAELAYLKLRSRLLFYFRQNGSPDAAGAADEVICRVLRRIQEGVEISPTLNSFCYGVANRVLMEERSKASRRHTSLEESGEPAPRAFAGLSPLENTIYVNEGLSSISAEDRAIWLEYHQEDRIALAKTLKMTPNALRIRISRMRTQLKEYMSSRRQENK